MARSAGFHRMTREEMINLSITLPIPKFLLKGKEDDDEVSNLLNNPSVHEIRFVKVETGINIISWK